MDPSTRALVRSRAVFCCEYCGLPECYSETSHHIEHIIARQHGGSSDPDNLALACHHCNLRKGPNLAGIDPRTEELVALFHPRRQQWADHFASDGAWIVGTTPTGRATVHVLGMNHSRRRDLRQQILELGGRG